VSKGRMAEAKRVLQRLRGREDVSGLYAFARYNSVLLPVVVCVRSV
jgi:hypothetical protein